MRLMAAAPGWCSLVLAAGCIASGERAPDPEPGRLMGWVTRQVALGPRVPGTPSHQAGLRLIVAALDSLGAAPLQQAFEDTVPGFGPVQLTNVLASFGPEGGDRVLFLAHWDSRPWCDRDPDPASRGEPLPGANDGGSGVAVLLRLAEALHASPPHTGVDLLFVDGEDLGTAQHPEGFFRGARRFARGPRAHYRYAVLMDMVGGRNANFPREPNSMVAAPEIVERVWRRAGALRLKAFSQDIGPTVGDDHMPLNQAGVPAVDIIDFSYPEWHTRQDLPAAMDPAGLSDCFRLLWSLARKPGD